MSTTTPARPKTLQVKIEKVAAETGIATDAVAAAAELEGATTLAAIRQAVADHAASNGGEPEHPHEAELDAEHAERMANDPEYRAEHDAAAAAEARVAHEAPSVLELLREAGLTANAAQKAVDQAELTPEAALAEPTDDQRARFEARGKKSGLRGTALGVWILTGDSSAGKKGDAAKPRAAASSAPAGERPPREGSTLAAVLTVLGRAGGPLKPAEVFERIKKGNLAPNLKGKTPEATVAAQMAVAAAKGKHGIYRPEPGKYAVRKAG